MERIEDSELFRLHHPGPEIKIMMTDYYLTREYYGVFIYDWEK